MTDQWYSHLPEPQTAVETISVEEVADLVKKGSKAGKDFLIVDVRRNDLEVSVSLKESTPILLSCFGLE